MVSSTGGNRMSWTELYVKFDFLIKNLFLLFSFSYIFDFVLTLCSEIELTLAITFSEVFHPGHFNSNKKRHTLFLILTRNAIRCNNRDDLLRLSFTLKISIFSPSRRSMMELILRKYKAVKYIHRKAPS